MNNRFLKILTLVFVLVCIFHFSVFAEIYGYTTISGTFESIEDGFYTESALPSMIIKDELLTEGKISAEFSTNINSLPMGGIVFRGNGIRTYGNIEGNNIFYYSAYIEGNTLKLSEHRGFDAENCAFAAIDPSVFEAPAVKLSVSFTSDGYVKVFINDTEMISTETDSGEDFGGEFGFYLYGTGARIEIKNVTVSNPFHFEHTAGEIISEVPANCMNSGKKEHSVCTVCGELIFEKDGVWTLTTNADLTIPKDTKNHIDKQEDLLWTHNESTHSKICRCGKVFISGSHDIAPDALEGRCTVCGYNKIHLCESFIRHYAESGNCITKGKREHYECTDCGKLYIRSGNVYIEKTVSQIETELDADNHIDSAQSLSWTYDNTRHYKICRCGQELYSAKHDISANALEGSCSVCDYVRIHTCTYTPVPEVPSNCMTKGKTAHYKCEVCKKLYIKNGENYVRIYTADLEKPKDKSNHIDNANDLPWTCDFDGHKKVCRCGVMLKSEAHDIGADMLEGVCSVCGYEKIHTCTYTTISAVAADCMNEGRKLHYKCNACGKLYIKTGAVYTETTENELKIPKDTENHVDSVRDLSWTYDDHTHKKTCRCGAVIASGNHSISESALSGTCKTCGYVRIHTCTYTPVPEVPSDCMTKGKMAHYKCEACNKLYIKNSESYVRIYTSDLELPKDKSNHIDTANDLPWTCDSDVHKKVCRCGAVLKSETHDIESNLLDGVCSVCGYEKAHVCTYTRAPMTYADCMNEGKNTHYKCNACGKLYIKTGTVYNETTENELRITKDPNNHVDSVRDLSWTYDDRTHKKTCRCGTVIASGNHSISESSLSGTCKTCGYVRTHTCTYTLVPEVPSDCITKGKIAHYKCDDCNKLYIKNGENYVRIYTADLELPKDRTNHIDSEQSLEWSYDSNGHKKTCRCGVIIASGTHDIPKDSLSGICTVCGYEKSHICEYSHINGEEGNCLTLGVKEHYKCLICGKIYLLENDIYIEVTMEDITYTVDHKLKKHDAVLGNCVTESTEAYWQCEVCEKIFADENAKNEIENIPKGEKDTENHIDADKDGICDLCTYSEQKSDDKLVYYLFIISVIVILVLSVLLVIFIIKIKKLSAK
ncbi:MAG: hypothetical protein E7633_07255 [Ruminococcaceae bacterium]|nr:hypothetical protein [Oscillospiraceae bacterium]